MEKINREQFEKLPKMMPERKRTELGIAIRDLNVNDAIVLDKKEVETEINNRKTKTRRNFYSTLNGLASGKRMKISVRTLEDGGVGVLRIL